jgi:hypothetical protein
MKQQNNDEGASAPKNTGDRVIRQMPSISSLKDLLKGMPTESKAFASEVAAEVRQILSKVAEAGGVIFIGDIAKKVKSIKLRPEENALKEVIDLAADEEMLASGVDLKAAIIHRSYFSVSRYYLDSEKEGEEAKKARRDWAIALEKLHKHFSGEPIEDDDIPLPGNAAA